MQHMSAPMKTYFLKAVCHVNDWPLQSELNTTDSFVNLCICNKGGLIFLTFYGRRKSEDHQPFNFLFFVLSLSPNQMRDRLPLNQTDAQCWSFVKEHFVLGFSKH